jgi:photosystem II stability/assembly factor-like uncharacterized protein
MDDFERRLRDALRSQRLSVDPAPDLLERVHAGARRRQRLHRAVAGSAAAVAVIALATTGALLRPGGGSSPSTVAGGSATSEVSASAPTARNTPASPSAPMTMGSAAQLSPTYATPTPAPAGNFTPLSVSAVSTSTFWVLGSNNCNTGRCLSLRTTSDGGKTFTSLPPPTGPDAKGLTATQIRFGNALDGWAYGNADTRAQVFFQTTDGGKSWSQVTSIPGHVVDLVAASGKAWAVVLLPPGDTTTQRFAIYSTPYGNSPQKWSPVALPLNDLGSLTPGIVDQDGVVTILASGPSRTGDRGHILTAKPGESFSDHQGPCLQELGGRLSNSQKAIWAVCPTGMMAQLFVSTDRGATWQPQHGSSGFANSVAVGAIDNQHAIVMTPDGLQRIGIDGSSEKVDAPVDGAAGASFIGFTNESTGFAVIAESDGTSRLLRTTDGGAHWSAITFGG